MGIDLLDDYYKGEIYDEAIRRWISENILKIKSLPTETLGNMRQIILDSYLKGKSIRDIQKDIQEEYNVSKRYRPTPGQGPDRHTERPDLEATTAGCRVQEVQVVHFTRQPCA